MQKLRYYHRLVTVSIVVFALFLGVTGTLIQMVDLHSILTNAPATDPDVRAMREAFDGPADFQVRQTSDYLAQALPTSFDYASALRTGLATAGSAIGIASPEYVEFRMRGSEPVVQLGLKGGHVSLDAQTGQSVARVDHDTNENEPPVSTRNFIKHLHRMTTFGDWALIINLVVALGLPVLIVTGIMVYFKMLFARKRMKRDRFFWRGGNRWRETHRWISIVAAGLLLGVTFSGGWLAIESAGLAIYFRTHHPLAPASKAKASSSVNTSRLTGMLTQTLASVRRDAPGASIKVLRLRSYGGYDQGVVVTGGQATSRQLVYNALTGASMSETEPGYPPVPFPFGWQAHQFAKSLHRGDLFGITGRWMDLLAGLAMSYLSLSGLIMYWQMWRRRRAGGHEAIVWT